MQAGRLTAMVTGVISALGAGLGWTTRRGVLPLTTTAAGRLSGTAGAGARGPTTQGRFTGRRLSAFLAARTGVSESLSAGSGEVASAGSRSDRASVSAHGIGPAAPTTAT